MQAHPDRPVARTAFLGNESQRLHVRAIGEGPPTIVLHGGPDFDHEYLLPDLDRLAAFLRLVYYDQRGRGRSFTALSHGERVTLANEVVDIERVRLWTGEAPVVLLGHSWGGLLALEYAIRHPDRVEGLVLVSTAPVSNQGMLTLRHSLAARRSPEQVARLAALREDAAYRDGEIDADAEYYRIHFADAVRRPEHLDQLVARLRVGFTREGIVAARRIEDDLYAETWSRQEYDLVPRLRALSVPTLLIHGEQDLVPLEIAREIADALPSSSLVVLADCGHFPYLEQPESFAQAIAAFLSQSSRRSARWRSGGD